MFGWLKNIFGGQDSGTTVTPVEVKAEEAKVVELKPKATAKKAPAAKKKAPVAKKLPAKKKEAPVSETPAPAKDVDNVVLLAPKKKAGRPKKNA